MQPQPGNELLAHVRSTRWRKSFRDLYSSTIRLKVSKRRPKKSRREKRAISTKDLYKDGIKQYPNLLRTLRNTLSEKTRRYNKKLQDSAGHTPAAKKLVGEILRLQKNIHILEVKQRLGKCSTISNLITFSAEEKSMAFFREKYGSISEPALPDKVPKYSLAWKKATQFFQSKMLRSTLEEVQTVEMTVSPTNSTGSTLFDAQQCAEEIIDELIEIVDPSPEYICTSIVLDILDSIKYEQECVVEISME